MISCQQIMTSGVIIMILHNESYRQCNTMSWFNEYFFFVYQWQFTPEGCIRVIVSLFKNNHYWSDLSKMHSDERSVPLISYKEHLTPLPVASLFYHKNIIKQWYFFWVFYVFASFFHILRPSKSSSILRICVNSDHWSYGFEYI